MHLLIEEEEEEEEAIALGVAIALLMGSEEGEEGVITVDLVAAVRLVVVRGENLTDLVGCDLVEFGYCQKARPDARGIHLRKLRDSEDRPGAPLVSPDAASRR